MAPRGKSIEEKRTIILNLFHDSCVPWLLKVSSLAQALLTVHSRRASLQDIEKAGAKAGVVQNTVKGAGERLTASWAGDARTHSTRSDIVMSLVHDDLASTDKSAWSWASVVRPPTVC